MTNGSQGIEATSRLQSALARGIARLGLDIPTNRQEQLVAYLQLLIHWNRAYNLTAVRDPLAMVDRHILDSLAVAPWIHGSRIADVGSGAGLPGIPLAILFPDRHFVLIDSNGKKSRFQTQCCISLGLANIEVVSGRVEQYRPTALFDMVLSRAFSDLAGFVQNAGALAAESGELLAMKGRYPAGEIAALPAGYSLKACHQLQVPGCEGDRHLLIIGKK